MIQVPMSEFDGEHRDKMKQTKVRLEVMRDELMEWMDKLYLQVIANGDHAHVTSNMMADYAVYRGSLKAFESMGGFL